MNPTIRGFDNGYGRLWWNGWLVGLCSGVGLAALAALIGWWSV